MPSRIGELLRYRGQAEADAIRAGGQIAGNLGMNLGNIASQAAGQIAQHLSPEAKAERAKADRQAKFTALMDESDDLTPEQFIQKLKANGLHDEAMKMETARLDQVSKSIDLQVKQGTLAKERLTQAITLLDAVNTAPEAERPAIYAAQVPKIRELVGPELGTLVKDQYDPAFLDNALTWGMDATQKLSARAAALTKLATQTSNADARDKNAREALMELLPTASNQDEWDDALALAKASGARPETLAIFGDTFSPEAVQRATAAKVGPQDAPDVGTFADHMSRKAKREGRPVASYTEREVLREKTSYEKLLADATRAPQQPTSEPLEPVFDPDKGYSVYTPRSNAVGQRVPPSSQSREPTEDERKSSGFHTQMRDAIKIIDELEPKLTEKELYQIQSLPQEQLLGLINRGQLSEHAKRYLRAFTQFTEARLRAVSGAAIADTEYGRDRQIFAKQYAETPALAADRRQARQSVLQSLQTRAGRAFRPGEAGGYKVNDVVTVGGRKVRITKVNPDGTFEGMPEPE
jgi:hypothetical protein